MIICWKEETRGSIKQGKNYHEAALPVRFNCAKTCFAGEMRPRGKEVIMYLLDTNICIYIIKKKTEDILNQLQNKRKDGLAISSITVAELEFANENSMYNEAISKCQILKSQP
jgi:predicted PolB exonuclease-like 3'-5' exonuclease